MRRSLALLLVALALAGCQRPMPAATVVEGRAYDVPDEPGFGAPSPGDRLADAPAVTPAPPRPQRPPTAPYFAPGTDGATQVPPIHAFWWALADDPDGDTLFYRVTTRVADDPPIVQCAAILFPPCELHLANGREHLVTVTATDGTHASEANVTLTARSPILLLPDLDGNMSRWDAIAARLAQDDFAVLDLRGLPESAHLHLAPDANQTLAHFTTERLAPILDAALAGNGYPAGQRFDLIALGAGGLVARILHEEHGWMEPGVYLDARWNDQVGNVILVGTPNLGADLGCDTPACRDIAPNSTLLRRLAHHDPPDTTWTVSLDADPQIHHDAMRIHRAPDTRIEGAGRDEGPYRDEVYDAILRALAMRRGG